MSERIDAEAAVRPGDIAFLFQVLVDGAVVGDFLAVENLSEKIEPYTYQEGGRNDAPHTLLGPRSGAQILLRWGMMSRDTLWSWMRAVDAGLSFRKEVQIHQLSRSGDLVRAYTVEGAWPVEWQGAALDSMQSRLPTEEIKLAYRALRLEVSGG